MAIVSWSPLVLFSLLLCNLQPAYSQVPTPTPGHFHLTFDVPENLWTESRIPVSTYTYASTTWVLSGDPIATTTITAGETTETKVTVYQGLHWQAVNESVAYHINITKMDYSLLCTYPISGNWSLYPRIMFWSTIIFALIARSQEWLIGGALAAALSFSSLAAIQISLQVWTGRFQAELDLFPIVGILVGSCIIAVPLMNWSSTIRQLGAGKNTREAIREVEHEKAIQDGNNNTTPSQALGNLASVDIEKTEYGSTRTVLVLWSLLVTVGFVAAFIGYESFLNIGGGAGIYELFVPHARGTISCAPYNGILDTAAGQLPRWRGFYITQEFLQWNNCIDPCGTTTMRTLFRSPTECQALDTSSIDRWIELADQTSEDMTKISFIWKYYKYIVALMPFILLQGIFQVVFFWRNSPQQARREMYIWISRISTPLQFAKQQNGWRSRLGFTSAITFYVVAVAIIPLAATGFIMNIVVTEIFLNWLPATSSNDHVDQWGVFAVAILVYIAAITCRLTPGTRMTWQRNKLEWELDFLRHQISRGIEHERASCRDLKCVTQLARKDHNLSAYVKILMWTCIKAVRNDTKDFIETIKYRFTDSWLLIRYEAHLLKTFWSTPYHKIKPRNETTDKVEDKKNGGQKFKYHIDRPRSRQEESRKKLKDRISELRQEVQEAERELDLVCKAKESDRHHSTNPDLESQYTDIPDHAPLIPSPSPGITVSEYRGRPSGSTSPYLRTPSEESDSGASLRSPNPQRHSIPRRPVSRSPSPSPSMASELEGTALYSTEVQQVHPAHIAPSPWSGV